MPRYRTRYVLTLIVAMLVWSGTSASVSYAQDGQQDEGFAGIDDPRQADLERPSADQQGLEMGDQRQEELEEEDPRQQQIERPSQRQDELEQGDQRQYDLEH